jgi:hypothetical protein
MKAGVLIGSGAMVMQRRHILPVLVMRRRVLSMGECHNRPMRQTHGGEYRRDHGADYRSRKGSENHIQKIAGVFCRRQNVNKI